MPFRPRRFAVLAMLASSAVGAGAFASSVQAIEFSVADPGLAFGGASGAVAGPFGPGGGSAVVLAGSAGDIQLFPYANAGLGYGNAAAQSASLNALARGSFGGETAPDIVATRGGASPALVAYLDVAGSFGAPVVTPLPPGTSPGKVIVTDLDGTGGEDVVVFANGQALTYDANGDGSFTAGPAVTLGGSPVDLAVGDVDGDGHQDLVAGNDSGGITIAYGNSSGGFDAPVNLPTDGGATWMVVTADFNNDGVDDFAGTNRGSATISVFLGERDRSFSEQPFVVVGNRPEALATGDLNGDGNADLAALSEGLITASFKLGDGSGGFSTAFHTPLGVNDNPNGIELADIDGDGLDDVLLLNPSNGYVTAWRNSTKRPTATVNPSVTGNAAVGATLTCDAGEWSGSDPLTPSDVTWLRDGEPILGTAGATTYVIAPADAGTTVSCASSAANELGSVTAASSGIHVPGLPTDDAPSNEGTPPAGTTQPTQPQGGAPQPATPAAPRIDAKPPALGRSKRVTISFGGDGAAFQCRVDAGPWTACESPFTVNGINAGDHTVTVRALAADGAPGTTTAVAFQVNPYPPGITLANGTLRASRTGVVAVRLGCSPREGEGHGACRGTVALRAVGGGNRVLGRASFSARAGRRATARIHLTRAGRAALRAARHRPLAARLMIAARDLAGNRRTATVRVTVR
jgi:hypothetical protein